MDKWLDEIHDDIQNVVNYALESCEKLSEQKHVEFGYVIDIFREKMSYALKKYSTF